MLIPPTVAVSLLPALSTAVPVADWPAPSLLSVSSDAQEATPERLSSQLYETVTGPLFQPNALASGDADPLIVGFVASRLILTSTGPVVPPALDAEQE